jgi:alpha-ketoglutarate-dependent 2,4-dichlorophenoxyacetate dioxygenase
LRLPYVELFDVSNLDSDGSIVAPGSRRDHLGAGNGLFHVDSAFNPRRAGYSLLRAHELPPKGTGGSTQFADTRSAWDSLPEDRKRELREKDYVVGHSLWHSRKKAVPGSPHLADIDPDAFFISRHRLIQTHEPSQRTNIYIAAHARYIEDPSNPAPKTGPLAKTLPQDESQAIIEDLWMYCQQPKFVLNVEWENDGDLVVWDNTAVMHRAGGGSFHGKHVRDMRRATVHDTSSQAWGLNEVSELRAGMP